MLIGVDFRANHDLSYRGMKYENKNIPPAIAASRGSQPDQLGSVKLQGVSQIGAGPETSQARKLGKECQTCKNRTYVDGSNDGNVSFKAPGHISPEASVAVVSSHEGEHVANAVREGNEKGKELVSSTVQIKMAICPECGRAYAAGGVTSTTIRYSNTPYDNARKSLEGMILAGANVDEKI